MTPAPFTRIALIGLGEAGQMLAEEFSSRGGLRIAAFDIAFADAASSQSAAARGTGLKRGRGRRMR